MLNVLKFTKKLDKKNIQIGNEVVRALSQKILFNENGVFYSGKFFDEEHEKLLKEFCEAIYVELTSEVVENKNSSLTFDQKANDLYEKVKAHAATKQKFKFGKWFSSFELLMQHFLRTKNDFVDLETFGDFFIKGGLLKPVKNPTDRQLIDSFVKDIVNKKTNLFTISEKEGIQFSSGFVYRKIFEIEHLNNTGGFRIRINSYFYNQINIEKNFKLLVIFLMGCYFRQMFLIEEFSMTYKELFYPKASILKELKVSTEICKKIVCSNRKKFQYLHELTSKV